jgi:hypothetical protein
MEPLTKDQVKTYLDAELGGASVEVDLEESDYDHIMAASLRALGTYMPTLCRGIIHISAGVQKYTLDPGTYGRGIIKLQRPYPNTLLYTMWPLPMPYVLSVPIRYLGDYALTMATQKESEHLFGADFSWDFDKTNGILLIKPAPLAAGNYVYMYYDDPLLEDIKGRQQWFLDYALAEAKRVVGSKYRKFGAFPGTENAVELFRELYQEGTEERTALLEEIKAAGVSRTVPIGTYRQG